MIELYQVIYYFPFKGLMLLKTLDLNRVMSLSEVTAIVQSRY